MRSCEAPVRPTGCGPRPLHAPHGRRSWRAPEQSRPSDASFLVLTRRVVHALPALASGRNCEERGEIPGDLVITAALSNGGALPHHITLRGDSDSLGHHAELGGRLLASATHRSVCPAAMSSPTYNGVWPHGVVPSRPTAASSTPERRTPNAGITAGVRAPARAAGAACRKRRHSPSLRPRRRCWCSRTSHWTSTSPPIDRGVTCLCRDSRPRRDRVVIPDACWSTSRWHASGLTPSLLALRPVRTQARRVLAAHGTSTTRTRPLLEQ